MEAVDFNKAPQGATHFLRYDSGYVVWCCVVEDGPNGLPIVNEWDSFNECWMPAIYGVEHYYSIGMEWIEKPAPAPQATAQPEAPKGATHRYDHACTTAWYREVDGKLFVWRDGSWYDSVYKTALDLANVCPLGAVSTFGEEKQSEQAKDDLTCLARNVHEWPNLPCGKPFPAVLAADGHISWLEHRPHDWDGCYDKYQWLARRAELQNKPSWADAPEWAEWLAQHESGFWGWGDGVAIHGALGGKGIWCSSNLGIPKWSGSDGEVLGDWRDTLERRPEITAKDAVQLETPIASTGTGADWYERGELPPVGSECEAFAEGVRAEQCKIIAYHKQQVAVQWSHFNDGGLDVLSLPGWSFRPTPSDRDQAIDAMKEHCPYPGSWKSTYREFAAALYDAGFKRGAA